MTDTHKLTKHVFNVFHIQTHANGNQGANIFVIIQLYST